MLTRKLVVAAVLACVVWSSGCGGGGGGESTTGPDNPIVCTAPFVPNASSTACVCPSGTHAVGDSCVADAVLDTTPPAVLITSPANGETVSGALSVIASASDDVAIADISLEVDASQTANTFTESSAGVFTAIVATAALSNGTHTLRVCAIDTSANSVCSSAVNVTVSNTIADTAPPVVSIASPANGGTVSGFFALKVNAQDDRGIASISLFVDGAPKSVNFVEGPTNVFGASLDSAPLVNGNHTLKVCATDAASNTSCSGETTVAVHNAALPHGWESIASLTSENIRLIWGSGSNDVWMGGSVIPSSTCGLSSCYAFQHWNGSAMEYVSTATYSTVYSIWGVGPNDVRASSYHGMLHWNGLTWSLDNQSPGSVALWDMWGSGPDDVWAVGEYGTAAHWNGSSWASATLGNGQGSLSTVWGSGPNDVWIFGNTTYRWNGSATSVSTNRPQGSVNGLWGDGPNDVWAVGFSGTGGCVWHWNGVEWSIAINVGGAALTDVWGTAPDDIWAVGYLGRVFHWDGSGWSSVPSGTTATLNKVWGSGANDVWAVGDNGTIIHYGP